jgi:hypothetical protein
MYFSRLMFHPPTRVGFQHLKAATKAKSGKFLSSHRHIHCYFAPRYPFTVRNFQQLIGNLHLVLKLMTFYRS